MGRAEILTWLRETDPDRLRELYARADAARHEHVGDAVHLRGLVEFSNHCRRQCLYCGLRQGNDAVPRYRLTGEQVLDCAAQAVRLGYGTLVLQSGEDPGLDPAWLSRVIWQIKARTNLAVTLSVGERTDDELAAWKWAGADRYLLRFESSNAALFHRVHPPAGGRPSDRVAVLRTLRRLGYEVGSGVMVGLPGQSYDDLASDILLFRELALDMIGVGPYLPHPATPLGRHPDRFARPGGEQVPADETMTLKTVALARLACPGTNIPATTALATLNPKDGRERALRAGANVIMPSLTPVEVRPAYEIYPNKACVREGAVKCNTCVTARVRALGRTVGTGPGASPAYRGRTALPECTP